MSGKFKLLGENTGLFNFSTRHLIKERSAALHGSGVTPRPVGKVGFSVGDTEDAGDVFIP